MADFNEVAMLLHIWKGTHEHGEQFKHIREAALSRLKEINDEHAPKQEPKVEAPTVESNPVKPREESADDNGPYGEAHEDEADESDEDEAVEVAQTQPQRRA